MKSTSIKKSKFPMPRIAYKYVAFSGPHLLSWKDNLYSVCQHVHLNQQTEDYPLTSIHLFRK